MYACMCGQMNPADILCLHLVLNPNVTLHNCAASHVLVCDSINKAILIITCQS